MNSIPLKRHYKPYVPTKLEARIDKIISVFAPRIAEGRMLARERMSRYRYLAAKANGSLPNSGFQSNSGETQMGNRERLQLMWNSIEAIENSGLAWGIRTKMCDYICGTLRYQARTGVDSINNEYEDYLKQRLGKGMDVAGRKTIRGFARGVVSGQIIKGDTGVNVIRDGALKYQGIEADRIGNPLDTRVRQTYIGGVHLAPWLEHIAYDIYTKNRQNGNYVFEDTIPARDENGLARFLLCANPITFDDIRGRTVFKNTLRNIRYLENIRDFELQALEWAASQSGVYYTKSGALPDMPFDSVGDEDAEIGNPAPLPSMRVRPNTVQALGTGEDVKMFQHDRPSPNVIAMYRETVKDTALGCNLSFAFCYDMSGMLGGAVRSASNQDKRSLITWKESLREDFLDPVSVLELGNGIYNGEIPPHPLWANGVWMFPAHPNIDVGRESAADINERAALLRSGAMIAGEEGNDIEEIRKDCSAETKGEIKEAIEASRIVFEETGVEIPWREFLTYMKPGKQIIMSPSFEAARADSMPIASDAADLSAVAAAAKAQAALDAAGSQDDVEKINEDLASSDTGTDMP